MRHQSRLAPDSLTTLPHFTDSDWMKVANWAGVSLTGSPPWSTIYFLTSGLASTLASAPLSLSSTGLGVAAGANRPNQDMAS